MYYPYIKRLLDIIISLISFIALLPLFIVVIIAIKIESKGPVFYTQSRLGKHGKTFKFFKFRSMYVNENRKEDIQVFPGNSQITKVGKLIRRFKIDELAQIINVIKGDMSIVGPRPSLPSLQNKFNEDAKSRLLVKPGLTGLAQVNGNIYLEWEERWKLDKQYVTNVSFLLDLKIILKTFLVVLIGEDKKVK